ncbi:MAG TPA: recombination regulator RecX [Bacillales bacterium]|nr:recombination regulator RecX [Bacillales bacterium]
MAKITRITTQKKDSERFNVYVDRGQGEEFAFGVSADVLVAFALSKGKEIDEREMKSILFEDEIKKAYNRSLRFLSYRMRTEQEIRDYLQKKDVSGEVVDEVVRRLAENRFIDDTEFAKAFVSSRKRTSAKGPKAIKRELAKKGVSEELAERAAHDYAFEEQVEAAARFAEKRARSHRRKSTAETKRLIAQTLAGNGFSREVIEAALREAAFEKDADQEWEALVLQGEKALRKYGPADGWEAEQKIKQFLYRKGFDFGLIEKFIREYQSED